MPHRRWILFCFSVLFLPVFSFADTSFIFSTEPQSVPVGVMSGKINIQSSSAVSETTYLVFTSSSPTGQFLNSSGNPQTSAVYISTGDSNRGIYYKDSTAGDFIINAEVQSKSKVKITSISQHIYIGQPVSTPDSNISSTTNSTATTTNVSESMVETNSNQLSAHSSPAPLSNTEEKLEFEISAGRNRLTEVGSSVLFRAVATKSDKIPESGITYLWSFGDGTVGQGNNINHTYKFAGEYSVVVNAGYSDRQAVSRLIVKVISPDISLGRVFGGVQINNNSKTEINLEGWTLVGNKKAFVFPRDTLIPFLKKVIFADDVTGMSDGDIQLLNPIGKQFASYSGETAVNLQIGTTTVVSLEDIQVKLTDAKNKLVQLYPKLQSLPQSQPAPQNSIALSVPRSDLGQSKISTSSPIPDIELNTNSSQMTNTATVFEAPASKGLVSSIFSWPIKGFNFIKHLFVEN